MKSTIVKLFFCISIFLFFSSCSKEEGQGGLATIKGKVFGQDINADGDLKESGFVGDKRVFISYGGGTFVDDEVRTSHTGEFRFENLIKGRYAVFVYSQCNKCPFNQEVKIQEVEITDKKQTIILPEFLIYD